MIDIIQALVMAFLQGIIEWLPISSEGQLTIIFINIYGIQELEAVTLALVLHLGTMLAVLWVFRKDFYNLTKLEYEITRLIILATIGTAITAIPIVFILKNEWEKISNSLPIPQDIIFTTLIGILLVVTGIILSKQPEQGTRDWYSLKHREILILGMAQGIAALPGISRSGMTITFLLFIGLTQKDALKASFIISVPAVLGATIIELFLEGFSLNPGYLSIGSIIFPYALLIGTILLTAVVGYITMNVLLNLKDVPYGKFCIGLGVLTILLAVGIFLLSNIL
ncbi:MAG: undecaprenyl-diphosphate phosphatase [Candidatus Hodarchaeales archaeon]